MKFSYEANAWGGVAGTPGAVTDIGTGFYVTPGEVATALDAISGAGYSGLELFDGNLLPFEPDMTQFTDAAAQRGLEVVGVYSGGHFIYRDAHQDELTRFDRSIQLAVSAGARHFILGGGAVRATGRRPEDFEIMAELMDEVAKRATDAGLIPSYHPHLGSLAQSPEEIDSLFVSSQIGMCADVAHIYAGGGDPAAVIAKYADRLSYLHMKDFDATAGNFVPLGAGDLDLTAVCQAVVDAGYDDWVTVECDGYPGDDDAAAAASLEYLRSSQLA